MIIVSMGAGLGNQLFEYAFYTSLKLHYPEQNVKLDTHYAFPLAHNGIEIFNIFNLEKQIATKEEVLSLTRGHYLTGEGANKGIIERIYRKLGLCPKQLLIQGCYTEYYDSFFSIPNDESKYCLGPFANYRYFYNYQDVVKRQYSFPVITEEKNLKYVNSIVSCNSVSIHIRRGDYLTENVNIVPLEYYYDAIRYIDERIDKAHYFIFSDDKLYAEKQFPDSDKYTIVTGNEGMDSYRDMQLMSMCKHNIITNSTFSFWAAYLNSNDKKIVIGLWFEAG